MTGLGARDAGPEILHMGVWSVSVTSVAEWGGGGGSNYRASEQCQSRERTCIEFRPCARCYMHNCTFNPQVTLCVAGSGPNLPMRKWAQRGLMGSCQTPHAVPSWAMSVTSKASVLSTTPYFGEEMVYLP